MWDTIFPYLLSGVSVGGQYALIAIGYTMVYGILRLINFAHGDVFMVAGIIMVYMAAAGVPLWLCIPLVLLITVAVGFLIERAAYKPLRSAPRMSVMISAIGVSYTLQNLVLYITGGLYKQYPTIPLISETMQIGAAKTKVVTVVTPILVIVLVVALVLLINKTKIGMAMRAVSKDFETSQLMGIKINNVISVTFIIGSAMAAIGSPAVLHKLHSGNAYGRCHAGPEGFCGGGIRRHRLHSGSGDRRVHHRYHGEYHQGPGRDPVQTGPDQSPNGPGDLLRCLYVCPADHHSYCEADRTVRRKDHGQGVR